MKVITANGKELPVDDSILNESDLRPCISQVTMIDDSVRLKKVWIATCEKNKRKPPFDSRPDELDWLCEKIFNHEPTEQELIYFMAENGLGLYDYCHVDEAYKMICEYED